MPQGIYRGYPSVAHDTAMTAAMEAAEDPDTGIVKYSNVFRILEMSGSGYVIRE